MKKVMYTLDEAKKIINEGKRLLIAGDEDLLKQLPSGNWVGGSIPYFMGDTGGTTSQKSILINELPSYIKNSKINTYNISNISKVYADGYDNGFSIIIIPSSSDTHLYFATHAPEFTGFATKPLIGWISGLLLSELGKSTAKAFQGTESKMLEKEAVVMHLELPGEKYAEINIINIFNQAIGDSIEFPETGFSAKEAIINGTKQKFDRYVSSKNLDVKLPLVADYNGASVNISFQSVDESNSTVHFYAPVFKGVTYKQAAPVKDYINDFIKLIPKEGTENIIFSCNCILNYLYSALEGKKTGNITGPITFGEIAYQLLNQTLVYLEIKNK